MHGPGEQVCHHLRGLTLVGILHKVLRLMEAYLKIKHKVALKCCKVQGESARFMVFIQNRTNDGLIMSLTYILVAELLGIKLIKRFIQQRNQLELMLSKLTTFQAASIVFVKRCQYISQSVPNTLFVKEKETEFAYQWRTLTLWTRWTNRCVRWWVHEGLRSGRTLLWWCCTQDD